MTEEEKVVEVLVQFSSEEVLKYCYFFSKMCKGKLSYFTNTLSENKFALCEFHKIEVRHQLISKRIRSINLNDL